jgi:hypothetical protein
MSDKRQVYVVLQNVWGCEGCATEVRGVFTSMPVAEAYKAKLDYQLSLKAPSLNAYDDHDGYEYEIEAHTLDEEAGEGE